MNLSIDDDEPFPYPTEEPEAYEEQSPAGPSIDWADTVVLWLIVAVLVSMVLWQCYGAWLAVRTIARFLWRAL